MSNASFLRIDLFFLKPSKWDPAVAFLSATWQTGPCRSLSVVFYPHFRTHPLFPFSPHFPPFSHSRSLIPPPSLTGASSRRWPFRGNAPLRPVTWWANLPESAPCSPLPFRGPTFSVFCNVNLSLFKLVNSSHSVRCSLADPSEKHRTLCWFPPSPTATAPLRSAMVSHLHGGVFPLGSLLPLPSNSFST